MTLEFTDACLDYGDIPVLRGIDLTVTAGRALALLGPNGAGKTTTLRLAAGLLPPSRGSVTWHGEPLGRAEQAATRGVCLIPEGRGVFRRLTVRQNLRLFARPGQHDELIDRATTLFPKLGDRLHQVAGTMSGGEQQMLALSRALNPHVTCLLIDEASLGLAPVIVDEIFAAITQLRHDGITLLIVEQYVDRVLDLVDDVAVLNQGRLIFEAPADTVDGAALAELYLGA